MTHPGSRIATGNSPYVDRQEGKLSAAYDRYAKMAKICRGVNPGEEAFALRGLGQIHLSMGAPQKAVPLLTAALRVSRNDAGVVPRLLVMQWYGEASLQLGDVSNASEAFREVVAWSQQVGDPAGEVQGLAGLARAALASAAVDEAERHLAVAQSRSALVTEPLLSVIVWLTLAEVRLARDMIEPARDLVELALETCQRTRMVLYQIRAFRLLGKIHEAAGDLDAAATAKAEADALRPVSRSPSSQLSGHP